MILDNNPIFLFSFFVDESFFIVHIRKLIVAIFQEILYIWSMKLAHIVQDDIMLPLFIIDKKAV